MKRFLAAALILLLLTASVCEAFADGSSVMYVKTSNGKSLNVRSSPEKADNIIGSLAYGDSVVVDWSYAGNDGWSRIFWGSWGSAYVMSNFLVDYKPGPAPTPHKEEKKEGETAEKAKLDKELKSEKAVAEPYYIAVRPTRVSGWVNFRTGPSASTERITSFPDGKELVVLGETTSWYKARDPETNKVGYLSKSYAAKMKKKYVVEKETNGGVLKLGTLNVNGEFDLTCKLPEGYNLQTVNMRGEKIIASVLSDDVNKPQLYLSIAYDDTYSSVERMNDLSNEELALLENTFTDMNEVEISYRETGYGTKLLVAKETGSDTDFVDILGIYKGYFVEFNMTPNPKAKNQTLSEAQIQMCVDFLTDVDFVPVKK